MNPHYVLQLRRRGGEVVKGEVWRGELTDRLTIQPQIWVSTSHYERKGSLPISDISPLLRSVCCAALLWKWAKTVHIRNVTPSYGRNSDVQSYLCTHEHCTISAQPPRVGVTLPGDVSAERKMKILLIGGTTVQSKLCPHVQCQTYKLNDFTGL